MVDIVTLTGMTVTVPDNPRAAGSIRTFAGRPGRPETCQRPASCGKVLEQSAVAYPNKQTPRAAVVGGVSAGGLQRVTG